MKNDVPIRDGLVIPAAELRLSTSRAGGPGGQHVNKTSTKVTLFFDVPESEALTPAQKRKILERLATRIDSTGRLRVVCQRHRSQYRNRLEAVERFADLLRGALRRRKRRRETKVPQAARRRRLEQKRRRGAIKAGRRVPRDADE